MRWRRLSVLSLLGLPLLFASPAAAAEIDLSTDARGSLFAAGELSTDYTGARCVAVKWTENATTRAMGVSAAVTGGLAPYLVLEIEAGTGGGYANCEGFKGNVIYRGTVGEFGAAHANAASQLVAQRVRAAQGTITYRLSVSVLDVNEAQSLTATADFVFAALDLDRLPAPPPETPVPDDAVPVEPSPSATEDDSAEEDEIFPTSPPNRQGELPGENSDGKKQRGPTVSVPLTPSPEEPGIFANPVRAVMQLVEGARELANAAAAPVAKGVAFGAWSLPALLGFLLLQNYFDRRDPKLAQAPVFASPSLPFDDTYVSSQSTEVSS